MFIPLHDINRVENIRFQYVTILLILTNVFIFVYYQSGLVNTVNTEAALSFALVPFEFLGSAAQQTNIGTQLAPSNLMFPEYLTAITYMFLHGSWLHLIGNMMFLWVFGDNVEDAMGHFPFLIFYILCGVAGGGLHTWMTPDSQIPLIGASGAVSGIIAAYLILHPQVRVWILILWRIPLAVSALWALGFWIVLQFANAYLIHQDTGNVAWHAHVGGIVAGAVLILFMRRRGVRLFSNKIE
ncbi:MAG: rhomboid family intramembrane serine protease [Pseudomonadota bacterium]